MKLNRYESYEEQNYSERGLPQQGCSRRRRRPKRMPAKSTIVQFVLSGEKVSIVRPVNRTTRNRCRGRGDPRSTVL